MMSRWFFILSLLFLAGCLIGRRSEEAVLWPNGVEICRQRSEIRIPARVMIRSGWLEQAVCTPQTRVHESVFAIQADPHQLHAALLLLGSFPGKPGLPPHLDHPAVAPDGPIVQIFMEHSQAVIRLQDLILDDRTGEGLQGDFVFAGSKWVQWQGVQRYLADDEGSVVGLVTFGDELLAYSEPMSGSVSLDRPTFRPNADVLPPPGTEVTLRFTVSPEPEA